MSASSFVANQGTQTPIATDAISGTQYGIVKLDFGGLGTSSPMAGTLPTVNLVGTVNTIGTLPNLIGGTLNAITTVSNLTAGSVTVTTGTLNAGTVDLLKAGTITKVEGGTIGLVTRVGNVGTIEVGTITTLPNIPGGTLGLVTTVTTVSNVTNGSIVQTVGTVNTGTINLGTVVGKDANAAAQTGNPISIGGTDSGGTVRTVLVNSAGAMSVSGAAAGTYVNITTGTLNAGTVTITGGTINNLASGTINAATAVINSATISVLPNLPQGSINITAGTINTGTVSIAVGTINHGTLDTGTVNVGTVYKGVGAAQAGSLTAAGTITAAGSQSDITYWDVGGTWVGTAFFESQVGTSAFFAANAITPAGVIGTQTIGNGDYMQSMSGIDNARLRVTYSSGTLTYNNRSSNFSSPLNYILGGSIANVGMFNGGTINTGTINNGTFVMPSGTVTVLPNLPQGSINVTAGTIATLGTMGTLGLVNTVTTVSNITNGSIVVTNGTIAAHAITAATVTAGTINIGTIVGKDANAVAQTGNPLSIGGTDSGGTVRTVLVNSAGALNIGTITTIPNTPGGTLTNLISGTINAATAVLNSGTINVGTFVMPSGTITVLPNLPQGSINVTAGTINTGTINAGTINTGTINVGTFTLNPNPSIEVNSYGTTTNATIGTLVAAPSAGSAIFITSLDINIQSGTAETVVSYGLVAQGNQVISRGNYIAGGGIAKTYIPANSGSATGTALTYNILSGAGTVSYNLAYFIAIP